MEEFEYFGIDADVNKVRVNHDFMCIDKLKNEIRVHQASIEKKEREVAAILESYRLANTYSEYVKTWGLAVMQIQIQHKVDRDLLRDCMVSRGLQVVKYEAKPDGSFLVHVSPLGMTTHE